MVILRFCSPAIVVRFLDGAPVMPDDTCVYPHAGSRASPLHMVYNRISCMQQTDPRFTSCTANNLYSY